MSSLSHPLRVFSAIRSDIVSLERRKNLIPTRQKINGDPRCTRGFWKKGKVKEFGPLLVQRQWSSRLSREKERERAVCPASDTFLTMPTRSFPIVINHRAYLEARFPIYSSGQPFYGEDARRFHREWTSRRAVSTSFPLASWRGTSLSLPERLYEYFPVDRPAEWNFPTLETSVLTYDLLRNRATIRRCAL